MKPLANAAICWNLTLGGAGNADRHQLRPLALPPLCRRPTPAATFEPFFGKYATTGGSDSDSTYDSGTDGTVDPEEPADDVEPDPDGGGEPAPQTPTPQPDPTPTPQPDPAPEPQGGGAQG